MLSPFAELGLSTESTAILQISLCLALQKCSKDFFGDWHSGLLPRLENRVEAQELFATGSNLYPLDQPKLPIPRFPK
jgi:hypothetical protein